MSAEITKGIGRVLVWFSAGVTSAVAAKLAITKYQGVLPVEVCVCDTGSEHPDNWRFTEDIENWLETPIKRLKHPDYKDTFDVYRQRKYIVGVAGAPCTMLLKKKVRQWHENKKGDLQIFGFDADEESRARDFNENNPLINTWFPLIEQGFTKQYCRQVLAENGIKEPVTYGMGFKNANCLGTGCVKGQQGYWNHYRNVFPEQFQKMAELEREIGAAINKTYIDGERVPVYLDELPPHWGNYKEEPAFQCSLFCGVT